MLSDIISPMKRLFSDDAQTVLRGQENRSRRVALLNGSLVSNDRSESRGLSARVTMHGHYGFASAAAFSREEAERVLRCAGNNARFLDERARKAGRGYPPLQAGMSVTEPLRPVEDVPQKKYLEACRAVDAYIVRACPNLTSRRVVYTEDSQDKIIVTSDAGSGHVTYPRCYIYVVLDAQTREGVPVELFRAFGGAGSFDDHFSDPSVLFPAIDELYRRLMDKTEGVYARAGVQTVILGGMMGGMLAHEAVGHTVEADLVIGGSVAGPSLNRQVASPLVTLVDFASTALGKEAPLPVFLDDEGVAAEDAVLIDHGILCGYMNSRETAEHFGMRPLGHARAWSFSDEPLIRMRNTAVLPGTDSLEDMIASIDDGYYLMESGNGQADLTGEFMFGVTLGYEIRHGRLGRALLDTTVSGIAFDMLRTVDMVSDTVTWSSSGFCGKKQPMPVGMGGPEMRCRIAMGGR